MSVRLRYRHNESKLCTPQVTGDVTNALELSTTTMTRLAIQLTTADTTV